MRMNLAMANSWAPFQGWWFELHVIWSPCLRYLTVRLFNRRFHWCLGDLP